MKWYFISLILSGVASEAKIVSVGEGGYTTSRPKECEPLPEKISKLPSLKGATPTNQWWSSLVWENYSQNLFPHPLGMVCHEAGLAVAYPGAGIDGSSGHIMGGGVTSSGDFVIGHSNVEKFPSSKLGAYSSWFITADFSEGGYNLAVSFGHGSPFVYGTVKSGDPVITFAHAPQIWKGKEGDKCIGVTVRGNHYLLFGSSNSEWKAKGDEVWVNHSSKGYFSVALLPDKKESTVAIFQKYAHSHVINTSVQTKIVNGSLHTFYSFETKLMEGDGKGTIFALYPHQWKYSKVPLTGQSYRSVRGEMKVAVGRGFQTMIPIQGVLPMLPAEGIADRKRMLAYLKKEVSSSDKLEFKDTYWEGKHLGKLASLSGIAEVLGEKELEHSFVNEMRVRLENWFTASEGESSPLFYYDQTWGTLIGCRPSYGSAKELNDHHFHYGYFIRAAAEVARRDPSWVKKWGAMVELLIRDIASTKENKMFPVLRCFDIYAGHSWASGHAKFADGNNQESSSESMNAWYGMMLWGEVTGNREVRDTGVYLFNTERIAVEEYWFDVSGSNFPADFSNVALGMVWGGKGAFATWFSGDIDCIHGINWLPFTPASIYMGRYPDYVKKNHDRIVSKRKHGNDYNNGWGDLVVMFNALHDPGMAVKYIDSNPDCNLEGGNTHAFMYHWIHTLDRLGRNDSGITSNRLFTNAYLKEGVKTYAAYNFDEAPKEIVFSDGYKMTAKPRGMTVVKGND